MNENRGFSMMKKRTIHVLKRIPFRLSLLYSYRHTPELGENTYNQRWCIFRGMR